MISSTSKNWLRLYRMYRASVKRCNIRINTARETIRFMRDQMTKSNIRTDKTYAKKDPKLARKYNNYHQAQFSIGAHKAQMEVAYCEAKRAEDGKKAKQYKARVIGSREYRSGEWRPEL